MEHQRGNKKNVANQGLWDLITGDTATFSIENRAFNYVTAVTFVLLIYFLIVNIYRAQAIVSCVVMTLMAILSCVYYFSRHRRQYRYGVFIYAISGYAALVLNYYINSGINGTTFSIFFLTFHMLIVISERRLYPLWITLHIVILLGLLTSEYLHPEIVTNTFRTRTERYVTMAVTYIAAIAYIFFITKYLTKHLNNARMLAEEKEQAAAIQNTQIKAEKQMLEKVNEEKNKLFSIISHDLRSPLDSIRGYLELISEQILNEAELANVHEELLNQTKNTSELLLNLLYWSKAQMQGISVHNVPVQLKEIVDEVAGNILARAAKKGIKITHSIKPELELIADKDMLRIILRNLVNNAIKFTMPGGEIFIKVAEKDRQAEISIRDTGIGIPKGRQDDIFNLKTTSTYGTDNEKGIGLGLMLCREFIEYMNGKLWFESEEGVGTVFYILLPMARK